VFILNASTEIISFTPQYVDISDSIAQFINDSISGEMNVEMDSGIL
jgi:hypothetical protein